MSENVSDNINYLANKAKIEVEKIKSLENLVENEDLDDQLISDFLEGETEVLEIMDIIQESITERNIMLTGLKEHIESLLDRKRRFENGIEKLRAVMTFVAIRSNQKKFIRPHYTASLKETPEKLKIEDESSIPSSFFKVPAPALDKTALRNALKEGQEVTGALLTEKGVTMQIRSK